MIAIGREVTSFCASRVRFHFPLSGRTLGRNHQDRYLKQQLPFSLHQLYAHVCVAGASQFYYVDMEGKEQNYSISFLYKVLHEGLFFRMKAFSQISCSLRTTSMCVLMFEQELRLV